MSKKKRSTTDAIEILDRRYYKGKPKRQVSLEAERLNAKIAREIHKLRTKGGLTQGELAKKVGTTPSVISRLEDADYEGHSLSMLQRIASALQRTVEIRLVPNKKKRQPTPRLERQV